MKPLKALLCIVLPAFSIAYAAEEKEGRDDSRRGVDSINSNANSLFNYEEPLLAIVPKYYNHYKDEIKAGIQHYTEAQKKELLDQANEIYQESGTEKAEVVMNLLKTPTIERPSLIKYAILLSEGLKDRKGSIDEEGRAYMLQALVRLELPLLDIDAFIKDLNSNEEIEKTIFSTSSKYHRASYIGSLAPLPDVNSRIYCINKMQLFDICSSGEKEDQLPDLAKKIGINVKDDNGHTPLRVACKNGKMSLDAINFLLQNEADVNERDRFGSTPFSEACERNDLVLARFLLNTGKVMTHTITSDTREILELKAKLGVIINAMGERRMPATHDQEPLILHRILAKMRDAYGSMEERSLEYLPMFRFLADEAHVPIDSIRDTGASKYHPELRTAAQFAHKIGAIQLRDFLIERGGTL
ncbi:MAG: ankyrin repeat domain-containing protein [Pseudomonadota bacterium]